MFNKRNNPSISFVSRYEQVLGIEEIQPRLYAHMLPEWWNGQKKIKPKTPSSRFELTIKDCPALPHFFSQAYVLPMWCDTEFVVTKDEVRVTSASDLFSWEFHDNSQFMNIMNDDFRKKYVTVAKAQGPWDIITSPGYSVYQMPAFYHFNENFTVLPGSIATDINPNTQQQLLIPREEKTFIIKRGEPLALYIPYKREKMEFDVRYQTHKDKVKSDLGLLNVRTKFIGGYKDNYRRNKNID